MRTGASCLTVLFSGCRRMCSFIRSGRTLSKPGPPFHLSRFSRCWTPATSCCRQEVLSKPARYSSSVRSSSWRAGDYAAAFATIQHALVLAEEHGLPQVAWWATWGAAAVCVRQGDFPQAAEHLEHLQSMLGQQHEWVLANVIDVLRQALLSQTQAEVTAGQPLSSDAVLSSAFEQLLHWGTPRAVSGINYDNLVGGGHLGRPATAPAGSTGFTWRSLWQKIKRIVKGELRLTWVEANGPASLPNPEERSASIPASLSIVTTLSPTAAPPSIDQAAASAQDQEPAAIQPLAPDQPEPAAESPAPLSITGHPPLPADIEEPEAPIVSAPYGELAAITLFSTEAQEAESEPPLPAVIGEPETPAVSVLPATAQRAPEAYTMAIYCLGPFRVYQHHQLIEEWSGLRGQAVLKYLVAHRGTPIAKDVLMDVFWPDADPEAARRNLHQAIYSLRQTLRRRDPDFQHIQFENNQYLLNPALSVWIDVEEFQTDFQSGRRLEAAGQLAAAMVDYGTAEGLYQGDFLEEDLYDDWLAPTERATANNLSGYCRSTERILSPTRRVFRRHPPLSEDPDPGQLC